jgi:hypothetical protein
MNGHRSQVVPTNSTTFLLSASTFTCIRLSRDIARYFQANPLFPVEIYTFREGLSIIDSGSTVPGLGGMGIFDLNISCHINNWKAFKKCLYLIIKS